MDPDIPIFKPRYPLPYRLGFLAAPLLFFGMLLGGIGAPAILPIGYWYVALLVGVLTAFLPFFRIREIRFANDLVLRRYFLPDIFVNYKDKYEIEGGIFHVKNRNIRTGPLENVEELKGMERLWSAKQTLREATGGPASFRPIFPSRGHGTYAGFWGLALGVIVAILASTWPNIDPRWPPGITFLTVYFVFVYIVPSYL